MNQAPIISNLNVQRHSAYPDQIQNQLTANPYLQPPNTSLPYNLNPNAYQTQNSFQQQQQQQQQQQPPPQMQPSAIYIPPNPMPYSGMPSLNGIAPYGAYLVPYDPYGQLQQPANAFSPPYMPPSYFQPPPLQPQPPPQPLNPFQQSSEFSSNYGRQARDKSLSMQQQPPPQLSNNRAQTRNLSVSMLPQAPPQPQPSPSSANTQPPQWPHDADRGRDDPVEDAGPELLQYQPVVLYRYQKPIVIDELKHPNEKYKDLVYRPKPSRLSQEKSNVTSSTEIANIWPNEAASQQRPSMIGKKPMLVGSLKLPTEREAGSKPHLATVLKLPKGKVYIAVYSC